MTLDEGKQRRRVNVAGRTIYPLDEEPQLPLPEPHVPTPALISRLADYPDIATAVKGAFAMATREWGIDRADLVLRAMLPLDMDRGEGRYNDPWRININQPSGIERVFQRDTTVDTCRTIIFAGFLLRGSFEYVREVQLLIRGGKLVRRQGGITPNQRILFQGGPLMIPQRYPLRTVVIVHGNADFYFDPLGYVVEPDGKTVNNE